MTANTGSRWFHRLRNTIENEGILGTVKKGFAVAFQAIRPMIPRRRRVRYNDVRIDKWRRYGDSLFPQVVRWENVENQPAYESGIIDALETHAMSGDRVVIVGGGWGVTGVVAAEQVEPEGSVLIYEGAGESVEKVRTTFELNEVADSATVKHAIVSHANALRGDHEGSVVPPNELPACGVLELDCEGAELDILSEMTIRPRVVIVETHGMYGSPPTAVAEKLESLDYEITSKAIADKGSKEQCEEKGIYVLTGIRNDAVN